MQLQYLAYITKTTTRGGYISQFTCKRNQWNKAFCCSGPCVINNCNSSQSNWKINSSEINKGRSKPWCSVSVFQWLRLSFQLNKGGDALLKPDVMQQIEELTFYMLKNVQKVQRKCQFSPPKIKKYLISCRATRKTNLLIVRDAGGNDIKLFTISRK